MKKCMVVVDVQNDFIDGSLGFEGANQAVENIVSKLKNFEGDLVFTRDTHFDNYLETQEGRNLPVIHCIKNTEGWQIDSRLTPFLSSAAIFDKPSFGSLDLIEYFQNNDYESVEIMGLVSNICVISTAVIIKTANPEIPIIVDSTCTDSFDPQLNKDSLNVLKGLQVEVLS